MQQSSSEYHDAYDHQDDARGQWVLVNDDHIFHGQFRTHSMDEPEFTTWASLAHVDHPSINQERLPNTSAGSFRACPWRGRLRNYPSSRPTNDACLPCIQSGLGCGGHLRLC